MVPPPPPAKPATCDALWKVLSEMPTALEQIAQYTCHVDGNTRHRYTRHGKTDAGETQRETETEDIREREKKERETREGEREIGKERERGRDRERESLSLSWPFPVSEASGSLRTR